MQKMCGSFFLHRGVKGGGCNRKPKAELFYAARDFCHAGGNEPEHGADKGGFYHTGAVCYYDWLCGDSYQNTSENQ